MSLVPDTESVYYSSVPNVIDISMFSNDDLELFCDSSEFIEKSRIKRRSREKSRLNTSNSAYLSREEIFEVTEVDEKKYLEIATSTYNDVDVNIKNLSADIEKIFESFDENVRERKDTGLKVKPKNKVNQERVRKKIVETSKILQPAANEMERKNLLGTPISKLRSNFQATSTPTYHVNQTAYGESRHDEPTALNSTISSVKAKISFFNELSKTSCRSQSSVFIKSHKNLTAKPSTIRENDDHAQSVCCKPNLVKCRIKQFEKGVYKGAVDSVPENSSIYPKNEISEVFNTKNLVSKLKTQYDTTNNIRSPLQLPKHGLKHSSLPQQTPSAPKRYNLAPRRIYTSETPRKYQYLTFEESKLSSIAEATSNSQLESSLEITPKKPIPQKTYDPFAESEKSLKRLGDIVHTIRSIREQGMTEISRDLFQIFKKSLIAANTKLAESKRQSMQINSVAKRVATVKPNIAPSATFPRVLKAIPKSSPDGVNAEKSIELILAAGGNVQVSTKRNDSSDSELTYERFVSSFERGEQK